MAASGAVIFQLAASCRVRSGEQVIIVAVSNAAVFRIAGILPAAIFGGSPVT